MPTRAGHHRLERPQTHYECVAITLSAGHRHEAPARGPRQLRFARRRRPLPCRNVWCHVGHARWHRLDRTHRGRRARALATRTANCSASFGGSSGRPGSAPNGRRAAQSSDSSTTFLRARDWPVGNIEPIDWGGWGWKENPRHCKSIVWSEFYDGNPIYGEPNHLRFSRGRSQLALRDL